MKKILAIFGMLVVMTLTADYTACSYYSCRVAAFTALQPAPRGDAECVFFGDYNVYRRQIGPETKRRLRHVASIYRNGQVGKIVCVGGSGLRVKYDDYGSVMMKRYLVGELKVPREDVLVDTLSYDSLTNLAEIMKFARRGDWDRIVLVSSAFHLYRLSRLAAGDGSVEYVCSPYSVDTIDTVGDFFRLREWIHHEWLALAASSILPGKAYRLAIRFLRL
ncbi:MAG: YdcF family protein [Candidatus Latescibacteria bacterium]|nr:YdcF family protein [Candidatus Latescibacterota bacterium]